MSLRSVKDVLLNYVLDEIFTRYFIKIKKKDVDTSVVCQLTAAVAEKSNRGFFQTASE